MQSRTNVYKMYSFFEEKFYVLFKFQARCGWLRRSSSHRLAVVTSVAGPSAPRRQVM